MGALMSEEKRRAVDARNANNVEQRKKFLEFDEAPANIDNHAFEPRGAWYTQCRHCGLAMAAHRETTVRPRDHIGYFGDDD